MKLEQKLKELLISTYEKKVGLGIRLGAYHSVIGKLTAEEVIEEIKNDTEVGICLLYTSALPTTSRV